MFIVKNRVKRVSHNQKLTGLSLIYAYIEKKGGKIENDSPSHPKRRKGTSMVPITLKQILHENGKKVTDLYYALRFKVMISYGETAAYCRCISMKEYGRVNVWKAIQEILNEWDISWEV